MGGSDRGLGRFFTVLLVVMGVVLVLGLAGIGYVMWRYRIPPRGLVAMIVALAYVVSPVDVVPEALLGPFGLVDDAGVTAATVYFVYRLVVARRMLADAGVDLKRRRKPTTDATTRHG